LNAGSDRHPDTSALDALLGQYALGQLSRPLHALVAAHLTLSRANHAYVGTLESAAGSILLDVAPVALQDRDARLAEIFDGDGKPASRRLAADDPAWPSPLHDFAGVPFSGVRWRRLLPGVRHALFGEPGEAEAELLWLRPGCKFPSQTHAYAGYALVLRGGFSDAVGHYGIGDIAVADHEVDHQPTADPHEGCVCFAVTEASIRLAGPPGRLAPRFFRR